MPDGAQSAPRMYDGPLLVFLRQSFLNQTPWMPALLSQRSIAGCPRVIPRNAPALTGGRWKTSPWSWPRPTNTRPTCPQIELLRSSTGFGSGWFLAACLKPGYEKIYGADFGICNKQNVRDWAPDRITLFNISNEIGESLSDKQEQFEFIHMSHVIEHVPKYSLLWVVDSLYWGLRRGGSVLLCTPNMEGP
jgi:hypothetical protein